MWQHVRGGGASRAARGAREPSKARREGIAGATPRGARAERVLAWHLLMSKSPSADPIANGASQIACRAARLLRHVGKHPVIVMKCWTWYSADGDIGHRRVAGPLREELGPTCDPHDVAWPRAHHRAASANCIGSRRHAVSAVVRCQHRRVDRSPLTPGSSFIGVVTCRRLVA